MGETRTMTRSFGSWVARPRAPAMGVADHSVGVTSPVVEKSINAKHPKW
jgi:hypothetical protein